VKPVPREKEREKEREGHAVNILTQRYRCVIFIGQRISLVLPRVAEVPEKCRVYLAVTINININVRLLRSAALVLFHRGRL